MYYRYLFVEWIISLQIHLVKHGAYTHNDCHQKNAQHHLSKGINRLKTRIVFSKERNLVPINTTDERKLSKLNSVLNIQVVVQAIGVRRSIHYQ